MASYILCGNFSNTASIGLDVSEQMYRHQEGVGAGRSEEQENNKKSFRCDQIQMNHGIPDMDTRKGLSLSWGAFLHFLAVRWPRPGSN